VTVWTLAVESVTVNTALTVPELPSATDDPGPATETDGPSSSSIVADAADRPPVASAAPVGLDNVSVNVSSSSSVVSPSTATSTAWAVVWLAGKVTDPVLAV
jgi:hypothetical protein